MWVTVREMGTQCQTRSIISESTADKKIQKMQRLKVGNQPCCSVIKGNSPLSCRPNHRDTTEAINKTRSERTLIRTLTCIVSKKKKKTCPTNNWRTFFFLPLSTSKPHGSQNSQEGLHKPIPYIQRWEICAKLRSQRLDYVRANIQAPKVLVESYPAKTWLRTLDTNLQQG